MAYFPGRFSPMDLQTVQAELARLTEAVQYLGRPATQYPSPQSESGSGGFDTAALARRLLKESDMRAGLLDQDMFADPAWHILLDLYASEEEGRKVSISSACIASRVPSTTALRWLANMAKQGALIREQDSFDGRRLHVRLSPETKTKLKAYLEKIGCARQG